MKQQDFSTHFLKNFPDLIGSKIIAAVSGGPDSVALLHLLTTPSLKLQLEVAHVHHGYRGEDADKDAEFVKTLSQNLGLKCHILKIKTPSKPVDGGLENYWRKERYKALLKLASETGAKAVATGHHMDDIAETFLMFAARGAGPSALGAVWPRTQSGLIRPLLPWRKHELIAYLHSINAKWREDKTNLDLKHPRNAIRHLVIPQLEKVFPECITQIAKLAESLRNDEELLTTMAQKLAPTPHPWSPNGGTPLAKLRSAHSSLLARWIKLTCRHWNLPPPTRKQIEEFQDKLKQHLGSWTVTLKERWTVRSALGMLWLEPPPHMLPAPFSLSLLPEPATQELELPIPGWRIKLGPLRPSLGPWSAHLPKVNNLRVRSRKPGDIFRGKKLKKLLSTYPRHLKLAWPVVTLGDRIVWVPGVGLEPTETGPLQMEVICP